MKKLLLGILIPVVLIGGVIGGAYYMINDNSKPTYESNNIATNDLLTQRLMHSFDDTKNSGNVTFSLDQDTFNQIIYNTYSTADENVKKYLKGIEISIENKNYHIKVFSSAWIVNTVVDLTCSFSSDETNYYLNITESKIGKVTFLHNLAFSVLDKALNQDDLNAQFEKGGVRIKADFKNNRFYYAKNDAIEDLKNLINKSANSDSLVSSITSSFMANDVLSFDSKESLKAIISLEQFKTNSSFVDNSNLLDSSVLNLETHKDYVVSLLNNNIIDNEDSHPLYIFDFLNKGYEKITDTEKEYVKATDLSSIGFKDETSKTTYQGYNIQDPNIKDYFLPLSTNIKNNNLLTDDGIFISEKTLNEYVQSQNILGHSYLYTYKDTDTNKYIANYITLDNVYLNTYAKEEQEHMDMVLGISVAGYDTTLILENVKSEQLNFGLKLKNENIYFGNKLCDDNLKNFIYEMVEKNLPKTEFLTFDGEGTFTIDFGGYLSDYNKILSMLNQQIAIDTTIEGTSVLDSQAGIRLNGTIRSINS